MASLRLWSVERRREVGLGGNWVTCSIACSLNLALLHQLERLRIRETLLVTLMDDLRECLPVVLEPKLLSD
jgi:hypothetical protein